MAPKSPRRHFMAMELIDYAWGRIRPECHAVEARKLLDGAGYDVDTLKVIRQAFDEACMMIALGAGSDALPDDYEMRLAHAVLACARAHGHDADALREAALSAVLPTLKNLS
jgi:hypothetical protein